VRLESFALRRAQRWQRPLAGRRVVREIAFSSRDDRSILSGSRQVAPFGLAAVVPGQPRPQPLDGAAWPPSRAGWQH